MNQKDQEAGVCLHNSHIGKNKEENNGFVVLYEISMDQLVNSGRCEGGGGCFSASAQPLSTQQASGQICEDDVNGFPPPQIFAHGNFL
jgi:hypothetical protein